MCICIYVYEYPIYPSACVMTPEGNPKTSGPSRRISCCQRGCFRCAPSRSDDRPTGRRPNESQGNESKGMHATWKFPEMGVPPNHSF